MYVVANNRLPLNGQHYLNLILTLTAPKTVDFVGIVAIVEITNKIPPMSKLVEHYPTMPNCLADEI